MPSFHGQLPLAIVTVVLSVAVYILFKELRAVKSQATIGAHFATSFQEQQQQQQQQQLQMFQQMPPQFMIQDPHITEAQDPTPAPEEEEEEEAGGDTLPPPRPKSKIQKRQ